MDGPISYKDMKPACADVVVSSELTFTITELGRCSVCKGMMQFLFSQCPLTWPESLCLHARALL